ncbi:glycoside hydrolase domain-containing protein [Enterococcus sp. AZ126]|uniref:glycoside hydrolase domain-containing protein n=1 Tax=Enterococcus sp. AZ126 TaxID=2774635 RepID=UPI003F291D81
MDQMVFETQKWLNKTYSFETGMVPQDGKTGWRTIYALRRALQQEMGITATSDNFGPTTERYFKEKVEPTFKDGGNPKKNIVKILQGGFWCKGINPGVSGTEALDGVYTKFTKQAVQEFQKMAGLSPDGYLTAMLMKALLDMSAFALLGDVNIRLMQQELNKKYNKYFGLLPCDGIYQRETNEALIYALQAELGMGPETANGYYGPGTTAQTPTLVEGNSGNFVKILQWALYVNGFNEAGNFDGRFTASLGEEVYSFRYFMKLPPYNKVADMTVIKGLLSSAGNTNRSASACDMATQLTKQQAQVIKNNGFSIVGRYLTGSVGVGANKRDKNLTLTEIKNITDSGLNIFPIYQDGGWEESYFSSGQGNYDGSIAFRTAFSLGFPAGTTIYFAVDVDIQDGDIQGTVIPYINKVKEAIDAHGMYKVGIYGTRNVCQKAVDSGAVTNCFVSDMSTGFSGNLGFSMPKEWAFDQFYEHSNLGFPIDNVAVSGRDFGTKYFNTPTESVVQYHATQLLKKLKWDMFIKDVDFSLDKEYHIKPAPLVDIYFKAEASWKVVNNKAGYSIIVSNGKVEKIKYSDPLQAELNKYNNILELQGNNQIDEIINGLAPTIGNGVVETGVCARNGKIGLKLIIKKEVEESVGRRTIKSELSLTAEIYLTALSPSPIPDPKYKEIHDDIVDVNGVGSFDYTLIIYGVGAVSLVAAGFLLVATLPAQVLGGLAATFLVMLTQL